MLSKLFHKGSSRLHVLFSWFSRPEKIKRTEQERKELAKETCGMSLYDYKWCSSSLKTRHEIYHLNIEIERRDIQNCSIHQDNLLVQFGELKAPCLRIEENGKVLWLDEPEKIIRYLHNRFDNTSTQVLA